MNERSSEGSAEAFSKLVQAQSSEEFGIDHANNSEAPAPTSMDDYTALNKRNEAGLLAELEGKDNVINPLTAAPDVRLNEGVPHSSLVEIGDIPEVSGRSENPALHQGNEGEVLS